VVTGQFLAAESKNGIRFIELALVFEINNLFF